MLAHRGWGLADDLEPAPLTQDRRGADGKKDLIDALVRVGVSNDRDRHHILRPRRQRQLSNFERERYDRNWAPTNALDPSRIVSSVRDSTYGSSRRPFDQRVNLADVAEIVPRKRSFGGRCGCIDRSHHCAQLLLVLLHPFTHEVGVAKVMKDANDRDSLQPGQKRAVKAEMVTDMSDYYVEIPTQSALIRHGREQADGTGGVTDGEIAALADFGTHHRYMMSAPHKFDCDLARRLRDRGSDIPRCCQAYS